MVEESEPPNSDEGDDLSRIAEKSTTHGLVFSDAAAPRYDSPEDFPLIYPTSCPMNPKAWWCKHCPPTVEFHSFCPAEAHRCKTGHEVLPLIVVEQYWLFGDRETCSRECEKMVRPNPEEIVQHCIEKGHRITRVVWVRNTKNGEDYQVVKTLEPEYYRMVELPRMDAPPHIKEHATCLCRAI
ncbi:hypothetical protein EX30DRAFT_344042 [Ascodesmis nigricans]|uniref:Uncharacterized protein n=1 Tax=Ascodesmis nigricans TaxID=341454 RepID=A0A4S2MRH3_9PEZI|nr:hypothetical protein EX30DRAFT_344042 [Ascodesmis nigricans]